MTRTSSSYSATGVRPVGSNLRLQCLEAGKTYLIAQTREKGHLQPLVGMAVDRWGSRPMIILGILGTGLMALPITLATELWQIYIIYSLVASVAFAAMSPVNITKLVAGWFTKRRGLAQSTRNMNTKATSPVIGIRLT